MPSTGTCISWDDDKNSTQPPCVFITLNFFFLRVRNHAVHLDTAINLRLYQSVLELDSTCEVLLKLNRYDESVNGFPLLTRFPVLLD